MRLNTLILAVAASLAFAAPSFANDTGGGQAQQSNTSNPAAFGAANNEQPGFSGRKSGQRGGMGCCYDYDYENSTAEGIVTNFNQKLAAMQLAIIEAMRLSTGQLSGNLREQSGAEHNLADQQDDRKVVQAIEQARYEAMRNAVTPASACFILTAGKAGGLQADGVLAATETAKTLTQYMKGDVGPAARGPQHAMLSQVEAHCEYFASDIDVELGICSSKSEMPDADIMIGQSLMFEEEGNQSGLNEERLAAANAFIANLQGQTLPRMDPSVAQTPEGRELIAKRHMFTARHSVAIQVLHNLLGARTPTKDSDAKSWGKGAAKNMTGYKDANFDNLSYRDYIKILAQNPYLNQEQTTAAQTDPIVAVKDIRNIMAVQSYMSFETYKQLEQMNVLLATQLAIINEGTRNDLIRR